MIVLGISPLDKDATVSLVEDGRVLFAAGEERFTRKKLQEGFPAKSLQAALDYTKIHPQDIDLVAYPFYDWRTEARLFARNLEDERDFLKGVGFSGMSTSLRKSLGDIPTRVQPIHGLRYPNERTQKAPLYELFYRFAGCEGAFSRRMARLGSYLWKRRAKADHCRWQRDLLKNLESLGLAGKLKRYDHHLAHAGAAFYASGYDRALIVTLDGYGSGLAGSVSIGEGIQIRRIHNMAFPHSLGTFYESVTSSLGFKPSRHEGKIVGLAAHGDPNLLLPTVLGRFHQQPGEFRLLEANNIYFSRYLASLFPKIDVAAAYQRALEIVARNYIAHYVNQTGLDTVVLAGGVMANVKMNQRIFEIPGVRRIFIYPNMGDGGCGTGAALLASREMMRERKAYQHVYFGPDYSDDAILRDLREAGLAFDFVEPIEPILARMIHDGKVVARFKGRMEYGPRALGNRSILYCARDPNVNQWLNKRLGRTEFMPFAPATLFEKRHWCYEHIAGAEYAAQFMTITFDCTREMKKTCPAAVHVDGTARPQLIRHDVNPSFYRIIEEYAKLSGIPSIINTSFNMHEEPIVNSPRDAIRAFIQGGLDVLAIGDFLVQRPTESRSGCR